MKLIDKTIFITGASRGIGQAIGLRLADAGANIIVAAKEELNNNFTSIDDVADQMIKAGGKALAIDLDVRDDKAIKLGIDKAVDHFGGIDVLINNVSAFCFTDTINTTPQNFDLLFSTNVRAAFLLSKMCFPYLKEATNPHIINISPPLDMNPRWFENHLAFTMSKYGMSMCTLGMAKEFREAGIGVNSLWPKTTIATTTIKDHFVSEVYSGSRLPTIMADAVYELLQKNAREFTGKFLIDEIVLRDAGMTDFTQYAIDPSAPLVQDLFIPNESSTGILLEKESFVKQHPELIKANC